MSEELTDKEIFQQATMGEQDEAQDLPVGDLDSLPDEAQDEIDLDHQPTNDDPEDYWRAFAESKGWKDSEDIDPAEFKGYKAFVRDYDRIQKAREGDDAQKKLDKVIKSTAEIAKQIQVNHQKEIDKLKSQLEAQRNQAKEDLDFDKYEEANEQLKNLESATVETEDQPQEPPIFVDFRADNPEVMHGSDQFDPDLNAMVETKVNQALQSGTITSEYQLTKFMERTLSEEKGKLARYQDKPQRKPPATRKPGASPSKKADLDPGKLDAAARGYYDFFIKKGMKSEAEAFLKESLEG